IFYHPYKASLEMKVHALQPKGFVLDRSTGIYFVTALLSILNGYTYGNQLSSSKLKSENFVLKLPSKDNQLDFQYMAYYVQQIEAYYVQQIEAYLSILGYKTIDDVELTELDLTVIEEWNNSKFGNFLLEDLFQWKPNIEFSPLKLSEYIDDTEKTMYPFIGQSTSNHGRISYHHLRKDLLNNPTGKPTLLIHSNNQNIEYIDTPFYLKDGHGATSILQANFLTKPIAQYLQTIISKVITERFSYNGKATKIGLKKTSIELPVLKNKQLDTKLMNDYIKVIEKKVVKKLKFELDQRLDRYNKLIK
ncbi:hypothetical protein A5819_003830, partial [Enterococcus sp. 7E2_DIV0204]|uniref:restriction endonuclease subunit S n=1 Tax=Enterococcus sp. 7E2_DIV0204 TaxID=1834188 RepID=UPI000B6B3B4E